MASCENKDKGPGCCGVMILALVLMVLWNLVISGLLHVPRIGYTQALIVVLIIGLYGAIQRWLSR